MGDAEIDHDRGDGCPCRTPRMGMPLGRTTPKKKELMMEKILKRFRYVKNLLRRIEKYEQSEKSMTRYIEQLETLKDDQRQRIESLQQERDELHRHLCGDTRGRRP
jgi:dsDNA-specific endonuclease/ATPase MutS2